MAELYDAVVLSPHLDDAALSCGGQIARRSDRGERVLVVTVFAADEPEPPHSWLADDLHALFGLASSVIEARRREDRAACEMLGAEAAHWNLPEAIYRRGEDGDFRYRRLGDLFSTPPEEEERLGGEIADRLATLPPCRELLVPLGVGAHVDHRLVRRAAELHDTRRDGTEPLSYYEELPYAARWRAVGRALGRRREWAAERIELSPQDLERKIEACTLYVSQIEALFGSPRRLAKRLGRYARKVGGERVWRRLAPSLPD
ncbi:MAG: PIG-L family deacetylase [Thermoanaerobaculia bacterium]|nr:PIG-L family deacetylase [Thermoanaerobaculia bacterium]